MAPPVPALVLFILLCGFMVYLKLFQNLKTLKSPPSSWHEDTEVVMGRKPKRHATESSTIIDDGNSIHNLTTDFDTDTFVFNETITEVPFTSHNSEEDRNSSTQDVTETTAPDQHDPIEEILTIVVSLTNDSNLVQNTSPGAFNKENGQDSFNNTVDVMSNQSFLTEKRKEENVTRDYLVVLSLLVNDKSENTTVTKKYGDHGNYTTKRQESEITTVAYTTLIRNITVKEGTKTADETGSNAQDYTTTSERFRNTFDKTKGKNCNTKQSILKIDIIKGKDADVNRTQTLENSNSNKNMTVENNSSTMLHDIVNLVNDTDGNYELQNVTMTEKYVPENDNNESLTGIREGNKLLNVTDMKEDQINSEAGIGHTNTTLAIKSNQLGTAKNIIYNLLRLKLRELNRQKNNQRNMYKALLTYIDQATKLMNKTKEKLKVEYQNMPPGNITKIL